MTRRSWPSTRRGKSWCTIGWRARSDYGPVLSISKEVSEELETLFSTWSVFPPLLEVAQETNAARVRARVARHHRCAGGKVDASWRRSCPLLQALSRPAGHRCALRPHTHLPPSLLTVLALRQTTRSGSTVGETTPAGFPACSRRPRSAGSSRSSRSQASWSSCSAAQSLLSLQAASSSARRRAPPPPARFRGAARPPRTTWRAQGRHARSGRLSYAGSTTRRSGSSTLCIVGKSAHYLTYTLPLWNTRDVVEIIEYSH